MTRKRYSPGRRERPFWSTIRLAESLGRAADILAPEGYGEIVGGGERMSSAEKLLEQIHAHNLPEDAFRWYFDLRRYGSVPHSGFGMGIERWCDRVSSAEGCSKYGSIRLKKQGGKV